MSRCLWIQLLLLKNAPIFTPVSAPASTSAPNPADVEKLFPDSTQVLACWCSDVQRRTLRFVRVIGGIYHNVRFHLCILYPMYFMYPYNKL